MNKTSTQNEVKGQKEEPSSEIEVRMAMKSLCAPSGGGGAPKVRKSTGVCGQTPRPPTPFHLLFFENDTPSIRGAVRHVQIFRPISIINQTVS